MPFAIGAVAAVGGGPVGVVDFKKWEANPDPKTNWDWVRLPGGERALFATELEAQTVGLACRWGNQLYSVHVVRGETNTKVTGGTPIPMVSCQN